MLDSDKNPSEAASRSAQRFHHGPLGQVLKRYLNSHAPRAASDYSLVELAQLWREAARLDPAIGLHLYAGFTAQDRHVLVQAAQYCADVEAALRLWQRYVSLVVDGDRLSLSEDVQGHGLTIQLDAPAELARYVVEHYSVMAITQLRQQTGRDILPLRACFAHARPSYHAEYRAWFGERVEFDCPYNRLYFSAQTLRLPLLNRHSGMCELIGAELERRLARRRQLGGWAERVAVGIRQSLARGEAPSLESLAATLHQSSRTLRRRLDEQDLNFRKLLDLVRAELEQQLELQGASRQQIALQLGYGDLDAYLLARKRWQLPSA